MSHFVQREHGSPGKIFIAEISTKMGIMIAGSSGDSICLLEFPGRTTTRASYTSIPCPAIISDLEHQLREYFSGTRKEFSLPLAPGGTPFQLMVWDELMNIKYGETRTYGQQADAIGRPGSVRAVANANGANRIAILIPCHRIIGSDGSLTGYGGGLERKKWLLEHEMSFSGKAYNLSIF